MRLNVLRMLGNVPFADADHAYVGRLNEGNVKAFGQPVAKHLRQIGRTYPSRRAAADNDQFFAHQQGSRTRSVS